MIHIPEGIFNLCSKYRVKEISSDENPAAAEVFSYPVEAREMEAAGGDQGKLMPEAK
jgi:hypothetical protein